MSTINYHGKRFRSLQTSVSGDVGQDTVFHYYQDGTIVWADYAGGSVKRGSLIAVVDAAGNLDMRYQHVDHLDRLKTGVCRSTPERTAAGRLRLHETWQWTCGDEATGQSVIEEIPKGLP